MAGDGVGVVSRGDGDVPLPEAATLSSAPLYGSTASPTRGRRSSVRARGFQFWREVEGAVPVLGRVGSTMEVEEPARTMSGGHDSVAAAAAAFSLHAVRRLDTAPAPIAATAGKNSVMAASSIDGSRGGGFPGASSSMVAWMAFCSPLHQLQLQQHGGRELSPAPVYSLHPPPSSGDAPISKPPIEPSSSRFQSQHAFAAAAHRLTVEMEHKEAGCQQPEGPILCINNCGFFGSAATMNMCSKCHKEMIMKEQQAKLAASSIDSIVNGGNSGKGPVVAGSTAVAVAQVEAKTLVVQPADVASTSEGVAVNPKGKEGPNRCAACRKRVGLTGFNCRCGNMYCTVHRYSDKHDCQFDYRSAARDAITKANPVVKAEKLDKI